jgi:hypothetical protein
MGNDGHQGTLDVCGGYAEDETGPDFSSETEVNQPDFTPLGPLHSDSSRSSSRKTCSAASTSSESLSAE